MGENREGRAAALLPILIFLLIFLGSGFITGDFYSMPAIVAFLIALLAAVCAESRELGFAEKITPGRHREWGMRTSSPCVSYFWQQVPLQAL